MTRKKTRDDRHAQLCRLLRQLDAQAERIQRRKARVWRAYKRTFNQHLRAA